ncbi:transcriptional regulation of mitochondrial recombination domain-containing protein [Purpureocillium lilacinum]|uniref:Large ribosomal subunit protein mL67 n=1 Tax=Purpureocillium lilacinum TaxID=33203 RepID=A0A179HYK4_PURLI|nr:transcriptional regulation of mitochondrial recombination domain-containing protein [Purpureocillium lilacinum]OAQ95104.1 transcriptional regulation of mitochondrial recombination domain-containing protein [Purpureocillium lilacinum]
MNAPPRTRLDRLPGFLRACVRQVHSSQRQRPAKGFEAPEGHGEKIWVFSHRRSDQIIYSFKERLDGFHDLKQLPFNGKKTKPAKLRKDYWSPLAMIRFPAGQGAVGRSVFQKLRELKHLHEVAWTDEFRYKRPDEYTSADKKKIAQEKEKGINYRPVRSKEERAIALNEQKANAIADMAVVLAGQGAGNKVVAGEAEDGGRQLVEVSVSWANDQDKGFAESWSANVTHDLFEEPSYSSGVESTPATEAKAA